MGRNNADFSEGAPETPVIVDGNAPGYEAAEGQRQLTLLKKGKEVSRLMYHVDSGNSAYIDLVHSREEGQGHAQTLIEHFYQKHPREYIDWGEIQHPAASHLYKKFSEKYGRSFSWEDDDW